MFKINNLSSLLALIFLSHACRTTTQSSPELSSIDPVTKLRHEDVIEFEMQMACTSKTSQYVNLSLAYSANGVTSTENVSYLYPEVKWDSKKKVYEYNYMAVVAGKYLIEKADYLRKGDSKKQIPVSLTFVLTKDNTVYSDVTVVDQNNLLTIKLPTDPHNPYTIPKTSQANAISMIQRHSDFRSCTVSNIKIGFRTDEALRSSASATLQDVDFLRSIIEEQKKILSEVTATVGNSAAEKADLEAKILLLEQKIKLLQGQLNAAGK